VSAFKLTIQEIKALIAAGKNTIGAPVAIAALIKVLGADRAARIVAEETGTSVRIQKSETLELIFALLPSVPGGTMRQKLAWAYQFAVRVLGESRAKEALDYVLERVRLLNAPTSAASGKFDLSFPRFYGRVNLWCAAGESTLKKDIDLCGKLGVGYHIEMAGWRSGATAFDSEENLVATIKMYRKLIGWCRQYKVGLFTSITNRNITETKYGNKGRPFASIVPSALRLAEAIKAEGPELQYIQPVAENNGDSSAVAFEKTCGVPFAGWNLVYNGNNGQTTKPAHGWPMFSYHPSSRTKDIPDGALASSNHGIIIRELAADGTLEGPGDPAKIAAWFAHCLASKACGCAYYAFLRADHDPAAIRACAGQLDKPEQVDDPDLSKAKWHGFQGGNAKVTETLSNLTINQKEIRFTLSDGCRLWEPHVGAKKTNQMACFFVERNGQLVGGRFDDSGHPRVTRELKNIRGKYTGGIVPVSGEWVWFCFTDVYGTRRTNCEKVRWP